MSKEEKNVPEQQPETYQSILGDEIPVDADLMEDAAEEASASEGTDALAKPKTSKKKILSIAGITAASVALVGSLTVAGIMLYNKNRPQDAASTPQNVYDTKIAACYYHDMLDMLLESYGEENLKATYGLDTSTSLKNQDGPYGDGTSWFDFVIEQTQATMEQQITVYEAAVNAGFTMPEDTKKMMEEALANADVTEYGNDVTMDDIRKAMEIQAMSNAYYLHMLEESAPTDDEIEAYYEANAMTYQTCGLAGFSVSYATEDSTSEDLMTQDEAKAYVDALCASRDAKGFEEIVVKILKDEDGMTQEEIDATLPSIYNNAYTYTAGNELSEWAFGGIKPGDTHVIESSDTYYIYMMTREPSRDESTTVNVRHILLMNQEDNMAEAERILTEWENGEATEESFAALANQYSEDGGSNTNGGLYESVYQGQMVPTFNDWCFDASRKPGDTGLVESDYGVHVMYFSGLSDPTWKKNIESVLSQQAYSSWYSEQAALYPVTFNMDVLNNIEG